MVGACNQWLKLFLILALMLTNVCLGDTAPETQATATLIVSYQTGPKGERLERIRFWLTPTTQGRAELYPKGGVGVVFNDRSCLSRTIVIENLPSGNYLLSFAIPNLDGLFEEVPSREITLTPGQVVKIDQQIRPKYASLTAKAEVAEEIPPPLLSLLDARGHIIDTSTTGEIQASELLPGSYRLVGEVIPGFETPTPICFKLAPGQIAGPYRLFYHPIDPAQEQIAYLDFDLSGQPPSTSDREEKEDSDVGVTVINTQSYQYPTGELYNTRTGQRIPIYPREHPRFAVLQIKSNLSSARWDIYDGTTVIYSGHGSIGSVSLPAREGYRIQPQDLPDYTFKVLPSASFGLRPGETARIDIVYQRSYGTLEIKGSMTNGERVNVTVTPENKSQAVTKTSLVAKDGKVSWQSPPLPTGNYTITYQLPTYFATVPPQVVTVTGDQKTTLTPIFQPSRSLTIHSNIDEALFLLHVENGSQAWKATGRSDVIRNLMPGRYVLSFSSSDPHLYISPPDKKITISKYEDLSIDATYQLAGSLLISSNVERYSVTIEPLQGNRTADIHQIFNRSERFYLPEGSYRLKFHPLNSSQLASPGINIPDPVEVTIRPFATEEVFVSYPNSQPHLQEPLQATLLIKTNTAQAAFTIESSEELNPNRYRGRNNQVPLKAGQIYHLTFLPVPNYETPAPLDITLKSGERRLIEIHYLPAMSTVDVAAGPSIIGDAFHEGKINELPPREINLSAFSIAVYEVTNSQFANWLNDAYRQGIIFYTSEGDDRGMIRDKENRLLFKTFEASEYSQITATEETLTGLSFAPLPDRGDYPVIEVSWYGAAAFCRDHQCRLPTEAEWEKAAGVARDQTEQPVKKFRFGFGQDQIDRSWANYRDSDRPINYFTVRTTPVGFYNGINKLPLQNSDPEQLTTHNAQSPYGVYDMSGNVWEWVADWYATSYPDDLPIQDPDGPSSGIQRVAKGGCYDSLADGVRVAERLGLTPDYTDAFTGFRIVKGIPLNQHHSWFETEKNYIINLIKD